jgi:CDP-4-dehydro-6-deoxyglucose reductase
VLVEPRRGPKYRFYDAEVTKITDVTSTVKLFDIRIPELESFDFVAGQFVQLDLPIASKVTRRSYSIATPPDGTNSFQLCIGIVPHGLGTKYLWEEVRAGSILKCSTPIGHFVLPNKIEKELAFISTGVGIAPFRSILKKGFADGSLNNTQISLFFGNRHKKDILYMEEWEEMARGHKNFHYFPVLSREDHYHGPKGYVHAHYMKFFEDRRPATFYLCGWRLMLDHARQHLTDMGYDRNDVKIELYD